MAERIVQEESLTLVADAIRAKGGTSDPLSFPGGFADAIAAIETGGNGGGGATSVPMKDVNFYDYDGTRLYSYTVAEAQALTELPALPTQPGLICQGWNWTLEDIKAHNRAVDVGAMYITDDGKTRLYITIAAEGRMDVTLRFNQNVANGVTIEWGDGSAAETLSGTGYVNTVHTYDSIGNYVISLEASDECTLSLVTNANSYSVMGSTDKIYNSMLRKVEIGNRVFSIGNYAFTDCLSLSSIAMSNAIRSIGSRSFYSCRSLAYITIPNNASSIDSYAFNNCGSLKSVALPTGIERISNYCFNNCYTLSRITLPDTLKQIVTYAFYNCYALSYITLPNGVSSVGTYAFYACKALANIKIPAGVATVSSNAFYNCSSMAFYDFTSHTSVPTLSSTNAFNNIPSDCQIRVPAALADEWKAATNWSTYASKIVAV